MSPKRRSGDVHGIALIHKPAGPTSFRVMRQVQRLVGAGKAGHGGTLDPMASGLLLVLLGEATKLTPWIHGRDKRYRASVAFGRSTDTLDATGQTTQEAFVPDDLLTAELERSVEDFIGERLQRPPKFSALKVGGRTNMSRARAGEDFEVAERPSVCHDIKVLGLEERIAHVDMHVGSGYYVRSFARDIGEALGVPSHLAALVRTHVGPWSLDAASKPEEVSVDGLVPLASCLPDYPVVMIHGDQATAVLQGKRIPALGEDRVVMLVDGEQTPLAMVEQTGEGEWKVMRGFALRSP